MYNVNEAKGHKLKVPSHMILKVVHIFKKNVKYPSSHPCISPATCC